MIEDHPFEDHNGPRYTWGPCGQRTLEGVCGKMFYNHTQQRTWRNGRVIVEDVPQRMQKESVNG